MVSDTPYFPLFLHDEARKLPIRTYCIPPFAFTLLLFFFYKFTLPHPNSGLSYPPGLLIGSSFPPGKHVVFGRVIRGYEDVIPKIVDVPTDEKDRPKVPIVISNCGELELRKKSVARQRKHPFFDSLSHSHGYAAPAAWRPLPV